MLIINSFEECKCESRFWISNSNSSSEHHSFLLFQTPSGMSIKGMKVRYAEYITLWSS